MNGPILPRREVDDGDDEPALELRRARSCLICADERFSPTSGPKSIVSFHAGTRASGKSSTAVTRPTRMSTPRKWSKSISAGRFAIAAG